MPDAYDDVHDDAQHDGHHDGHHDAHDDAHEDAYDGHHDVDVAGPASGAPAGLALPPQARVRSGKAANLRAPPDVR